VAHNLGFNGQQMASARVTIACRFSMTDADNAFSCAKNPGSHFIMAMWTSATCNDAADLPRHYSGVVAKFNRKDWAVERGFQVPAAPSSDIRQAKRRLSHSWGFLVWRFRKKGGPAMLRMMNAPLERSIEQRISFLQI
jgi:hypothetical protein